MQQTEQLDRHLWHVADRYVIPNAIQGRYDAQGNGVPLDVVWGEHTLLQSDGRQFCSGAAWWLLVELLRLAGLEAHPAITKSVLMDLRKFAWVWSDQEHHGGLPEGLVKHGLGVWVCEGETYPDPSLFVEGRFFQYWSSWSNTSGGAVGHKGHTGIIADRSDSSGNFAEWSSSPLLALSPDKKPQSIGRSKWFIASLHFESFAKNSVSNNKQQQATTKGADCVE